MVALTVVGSEMEWRLDGEWPDVVAANRFLAHLATRGFAAATVRAYAYDVLNFGRFCLERGLGLDDVAASDIFEAFEDHGLVFCLENGKPLHPDAVTSRLRLLARKLDLPWVKVHGLRHTYATLLLKAGVHPKVVQERLGHGSISITMDTYSHAIPSMQSEAADLGAALIDCPSDGEEQDPGDAAEEEA